MVMRFLASSALVALLATREVAVTFDDLPGNPVSRDITVRLLHAITEARVPAVGFVNENKLDVDGAPARDRVALLQLWLDAGLELGNHTYSHPDLHRTDVAAYEADIARGERVLRTLTRPRWFRHPFLHTGTSLATRQHVEHFLAARGYRVAPVTLDNSEWIFARAYQLTSDRATRQRIGNEYLAYMDRKLAYYEQQSQKLFGRNIRHVLLLHANALNADWFDELAASMRTRGYTFITLDRALEDDAYRSEDAYVGREGITWIHRWALTQKKPPASFAGEPKTPKWVMELARIEEE